MQIGEVARRIGVTTKTIRYYESIGLLPPARRTESGYRTYGSETVDRLQFIRDAQATGLNLTEIQSIHDHKDHGERTCEHTRSLLHRQIAEIDEQLDRLRETRGELARLAARADGTDPAACNDPHRCQVIAARHA